MIVANQNCGDLDLIDNAYFHLHVWQSRHCANFQHCRSYQDNMSFLSKLRSFISREPHLSFSQNGPPLDPSESYEFLIVVNFEKENSARLCEKSMAHLELPTQVKEMKNGRWNINITFTAKADVKKLAVIKNSIEESAASHDGKMLLFAAQFR